MIDSELIRMRELKPPPGSDFWVFAYGSLMWRPGFDHAEARPALLKGYHRAFCISSTHYRGSPEKPGLVLGLDRGGACRGRAYRIAAEQAGPVARYLHEREMVTGVYEPRWLRVVTPEGPLTAVTYVADRRHPQYAGKLSEAEIVALIRQGVGVAGSNIDYLANTVCHLDELGIVDGPLHRLLRKVQGKD
ncbi:MAG TPA: gamma-glutamylcyclotransferase [Dongiaceae bacterium]|nr:gamma-glutamylcyclotransferase [Dongiaceae bacterium]